MNKISKRLKTIVSLIPENSTLVDVGCDHGLVIIEAFLQKKITKALAVDNKVGPLNTAKQNVQLYPFYEKVTFALADGLTQINQEFNVIVVAGMGGLLIKSILEKSIHEINHQLLILQPNRNSYELRHFLSNASFTITDEVILQEDRKYYEIILAEKTVMNCILTEKELIFGPVLLKKKEQVFVDKWTKDLNRLLKLPKLSQDRKLLIQYIQEALS